MKALVQEQLGRRRNSADCGKTHAPNPYGTEIGWETRSIYARRGAIKSKQARLGHTLRPTLRWARCEARVLRAAPGEVTIVVHNVSQGWVLPSRRRTIEPSLPRVKLS